MMLWHYARKNGNIDRKGGSMEETLRYLCIILYIPLRRLKVAILPFSDIFLNNNGPVANSGIQLPIPLNL